MPKGYMVAGFVALLVAAYLIDEWTWRVKPRAKLIAIIEGPDWLLYSKALAVLRRRGEDLDVFLPRFLPGLAAESKRERVWAQSIVRKFYPQVARELEGYSPMAAPEVCRERIAPLLARYGTDADA